MYINSVNKQSFKGNINISGLSTAQQQVLDNVYFALAKKVKPIKYLNLNISGSLDKDIISVQSGKEPKYFHISTQVKSATVPTGSVAVESLGSDNLLKVVQDLISKHINSNFYKEFVEKQNKKGFFSSVFAKIFK